jgi:hypothetical protein
MNPATRATVQPILDELDTKADKVLLVGELRRGEENPSERADILVMIDSGRLPQLGLYVNNNLGRVMHGRVGPNDELSNIFPTTFMRVTGRIKMCLWFCSPRDFGLMAFKLSGPALFVQRALQYWTKISDGGAHSGGALIDNKGDRLDTDTEEKVFTLLQCKWISPERRR